MHSTKWLHTTAILIGLLFGTALQAATLTEFTRGMQPQRGFFDFYWDAKQGKIWLQIEHFDEPFLYVNYLQAGVGSNDIGLDRGQPGADRIVKFIKIGPKVLLLQPNLNYRALSENSLERRAVEEAFAQSVLWGFQVEVEDGNTVLIDATDFLLRDSHGIVNRLTDTQQGNYQLEASRSALYLPRSKSFPDNTEFEALISFSGEQAGDWLRSVTPSTENFSVRTHHSFVRLPAKPHTPRVYDPRSGAIFIAYRDYAAPLDQSIEKKWVIRHRLEKKHPERAISDPVEPIVYYLDPGTPEPIRTALLDGARWWAQAFEAIGFSNAFYVKMLPPDADPLDIRYNTIQWVHRSTRGWSYGSSIVDPRSGEILKGHVTLGSLRVRQDILIAQGLLSPYKNGNERPAAIQEMALARLRQLSAHEVGHTLGIIHNFYASVNARASVMDYPHPLIKIDASGTLNLSDAYAVGIGAWDNVALDYLYREFLDAESEQQSLQNILIQARQQGLLFIADADARTPGGSHPYAHLWDNGADPVISLQQVLKVRQKALADFGLNSIPVGQALFELEQVLVPIYLLHRYQTEAAVKLVGGVHYRYALRGEPDAQTKPVAADMQQQALQTLMITLHPEQLAIPESTLRLLLPPPEGSTRHREHFISRNGPHFDILSAAEAAARHTVALLLHPERAARLVEQAARDPQLPGLQHVIEMLLQHSWRQQQTVSLHAEIQNSVNAVVLQELIKLAADPKASPQTRALVTQQLLQLAQDLQKSKLKQPMRSAMAAQAVRDINRFVTSGETPTTPQSLTVPPGSPIGAD